MAKRPRANIKPKTMKKEFLLFLSSLCTLLSFAQEIAEKKTAFSAEQFPVFSNCEDLKSVELEKCFYSKVQDFVFQNFVVPKNLSENNYKIGRAHV